VSTVVKAAVVIVLVALLWSTADPTATGSVLRVAAFALLLVVALVLVGRLRRAYPLAPPTPLDTARPSPRVPELPVGAREALGELRTATVLPGRTDRALVQHLKRLAAGLSDPAGPVPLVPDTFDPDDPVALDRVLRSLEERA
jgi:hypothetical protein